MSMYLRIKRKKQTIFLHVEPSDSFGAIKKQLSEILEMEPTNIGLHAAPDKSRELQDMATISDQDIKNDSILFMVFRKSGGDAWEDIDVVSTDPHDSGGAASGKR